ncbi:MAG: amino acid adenylation domain-containing protein [Bacteroidetes bacterium]|nr:amino acid adenylation domain-containing protein [Bacteroidota bacterium]
MTTLQTDIPTGRYVLSSAQNRFWFIENMEANISASNNPLDYHISGELDPALLEQSLRVLVSRHEALRTVFTNGSSAPSQKILDQSDVTLHRVDLSKETPEMQKELVALYSKENASRKFNFSKGPLCHFELITLGNNEYVFLMNFHHIISDAGSIDTFLDELKTTYRSLKEGKPIDLPEIGFTYKDFALRESQWLESKDYRKKLDYWVSELAGAPDQMNLPFDFPRQRIQNFRGDEVRFYIGKELRDSIAELSRSRSASLPVFLLTVYGVLLNRYSMQDDMVIGVPFANRNQEELLSLFGVLINTLPIRIPVRAEETFRELLGEIRNRFLTGYENMEVPLERIVDEIKAKRIPGMNPVYQVLFNYLTVNHKVIDLPGGTMTLQDGVRKFSQVDLTLTIHDERDRLHCVFQYNTDLFSQDTINRFAGHFLTILKSVVAGIEKPVKDIPLLTSAETRQMTGEWNDTTVAYSSDQCIHQLFEKQAAKTPGFPAVADHRKQLSYSELNQGANKLAHYLRRRGVGENTKVAIFLERSAELVMAMLAVSKTGATYLPLDPIFPKARLEAILEDAGALFLITQDSLRESLPASGAETLYFNQSVWEKESSDNLPPANPRGTAYVLYTSGSTGKPKGVPIRKHSVVNLLESFSRLLDVTSQDTLLAITTVSFDIAELEIFLPLINGARLVMAPKEAGMDMEILKRLLTDSGATIFQATPVTYKMLLQSGWIGNPNLKVVAGGEAFPKDLGRSLYSGCKEVWNAYGPTETTIYSSAKKLDENDLKGEGFIPIGRPIANNTFYVVNPGGMQPVPIGIPGELYIGGEGVSDGYLNLPVMNAERFVPNPFSSNSSEKIYRTGDLVKYLPDGNVVYLNRADSQVKIRGFRIELGEIETVLSQCTGVKENVVIVIDQPSGGKMLAAYYTRSGTDAVDHAFLRQSLKVKLPDYMVPSIFIEMESLPLTANKKVDRNALPRPESIPVPDSAKHVEPSTPTEKALVKIWQSILNIERVGIHDDFFDIGGHSLIAVSLIQKIEKEFKVRLPLATLFDRNTIHRLARQIDEGTDPVVWRSLVPIRPAGTKKPLFLIHGMGLNVLLYTTVINHLDPDQPVYGLQAKGLSGSEVPLESIEAIASYYISEIMTVDPEGPYALAGFSFGGKIAFEMAQQLTAMGKKAAFLGLLDTTADESFSHLPWPESSMKRIQHMFNYMSWNIMAFFSETNETKMAFLRRRWIGLQKKIKGPDYKGGKDDLVSKGTSSELPKYLRKVHSANRRAHRKYVLKPYPGSVHLFKAKEQTFYIADPVTYGWNTVASGGVTIHEIPGEHSSTFAPPNDKFFATVLQKNLNESF